MQPPSLRCLCQTIIVRTLVCKPDDCIERRLLIGQFRSSQGSCLSEDVLVDIIENFHQQLTNEVLYVLAPKHMKHLKIKECSRVTCDGLVKTITRCSQLNQLDFSGCISLLHPTVFCCLKDFAPHMTRLMFEDCEIMTDDSVQIILMCCPKLEHLNISSCKNLTDNVFDFTSSTDKSKLSQRVLQAGRNLSSVDISGCQSLTSVAIRNLVLLCGSTLTSINIAWTGVGCIALLYLSGLSQQAVIEFVRQTDPSCSGLVELSSDDSQENTDSTSNNKPTSSGEDINCTNTDDTGPSVSCDGESSEQNQDILVDTSNYHPNTSNQDNIHDSQHSSVASKLGDTHDYNQDKTKDTLQKDGSCDDQDGSPSNKANVDADKTYSMISQDWSTSTLHHDKPSLDDKLTWQHIDQSCSNDYIWSDDVVVLDSVSSAFGEGISCLTNAIINLDLSDDNDDGDDTNHNDNDDVIMDDTDDIASSQTQGLSNILHSNQDSSKQTELTQSSVIHSKDEGNKHLANEELALDELDKHLAGIFSIDEVTSVGMSPPLHGFSDALMSLSTAMEDLINEYDSDDKEDGDGNNSTAIEDKINDYDNEDGNDNIDEHQQKEASQYGSADDRIDEKLKSDSLCSCHGDGSHSDINGPLVNQHDELEHNDRSSHDNMDVKVSLDCVSMEQVKLVVLPREESSTLDIVDTVQCLDTKQVMSDVQSQNEPIKTDIDQSRPLCERDTEEYQNPSTKISSPKSTKNVLTLTHKPQLQAINISNIYFHSKLLGVACLRMFMRMNKSLNSFAMSWSELDDETLIGLIKYQPQLCSLTLIDCANVTDRSLEVLPVYCPKLNQIDLKGVPFITDCGVVPMLSCPSLQTLSLAEASVSDMSMFAIAEKCSDKLCDLDLSWCEDLTDKGMSAVVTSCTGLHTLALRQCAASFVTIETLACCRGLTSLNIAGINQLTDQMVVTMATNLPNLTFIDVSWNLAITSVGISALMLNCCKLHEANLSGLKALTSKPFLPIISDLRVWRSKQEVMLRRKFKSQQHKRAVENYIKPCPMEMAIRLGDDLPYRSTTYCPVLRSLVLEYSDKVNDDHMAQIVAVCRGTLHVSDYYSQPIEPKWIFFDWTNISLE